MQANFRFLVSDAADLRRQTADADLMLDWDDVLEVRLIRLVASCLCAHRAAGHALRCSMETGCASLTNTRSSTSSFHLGRRSASLTMNQEAGSQSYGSTVGLELVSLSC